MTEKSKIIGYRTLSEDEIAIMNKVKKLANQVGYLIDSLEQSPEDQASGSPARTRMDEPIIDQRWLAVAKTQLQQGFRALNRAIDTPESF